jgi:outer membrane receptor protein involved in Fe transport
VLSNAPLSLRTWYSIQQTRDDATDLRLTNSPQGAFNAAASWHNGSGAHSALTVRQESGRRTFLGTETGSFARADLNIGYTPVTLGRARWLTGMDVSLRVSNVFDTRYAVPAGLEHTQNIIEQDGRMVSLRLGWAY